MIAALLDAAGLDPTVINGGIINAYGTNARLGAGDWMVVEADESDGTFIKLPATIAVVTNIDPEHLDFYGSFDKVRDGFRSFVENIPFYGFAALCIDHPEVQALIPARPRPQDRHLWFQSPGRCARRDVALGRDGAELRRRHQRPPHGGRRAHRRHALCRCSARTMCRIRWRRSRSATSWASRRRRSARRWPGSRGSSAASPGPARPAASP